MESKELRGKNKEELGRVLDEHRNGLRAMRFLLASGKVKNHREFRERRKTIARVLTLLRDYEH